MSKSAFIVLVIISALFLGHCSYVLERNSTESKPSRETEVVVRTDTVYKTDTLRIVETKKDIVEVRVTDTVYLKSGNTEIELPITQLKYDTPNYSAWISGYKPNLDSVQFYSPNKIITNTIRIEPRKWGLGIIGGYGIGRSGLSPYIGVGVYYRIW